MEITVPQTHPEEVLKNPLVEGLLEHISDGVVVIAAQSRKILAMNGKARNLLGYQKKEVMGCQCRKVMNSPACSNACPLTALLEGRKDESSLQLYYRGKSHHMLHADTRMLLVRDQQGNPLLGIELFRDLREVEDLRKALGRRRSLAGIIGRAASMQALFELIEQVAPFPIPVLIRGESGVGKERFADAIHQLSPRSEKALVKINCATLSRELAESELFGHRRGAFTGAIDHRKGYFEEADGGTLLLDEIGELPLELQAKLLRVLQEGEIQRLGEDRARKVDVRIVAATNRNLEGEVREGRFRQDLYFRLSGVRLDVPPLRERLEDLPLLADFFLTHLADVFSCSKPQLTDEARSVLLSRSWPGNVRELENVLRLATIRALAHGRIDPEHIEAAPDLNFQESEETTLNLKEVERITIEKAMLQARGNVASAARLLGIDRTTLWRKLK